MDELGAGFYRRVAHVVQGMNAPAQTLPCLEEQYAQPCAYEAARGGDSRHTGTDDDDICHLRSMLTGSASKNLSRV
jgi:hypothetical protein